MNRHARSAFQHPLNRLPLALVLTLLSMSFLLSGCWDEIDMTEQGYVSALGVDYVDKSFVVYAQFIQFSSVAKSDSRTPDEPKVWVGTAKGKTLLTAIGNLQKTAQFVLNLEHMKVLIVHERGLPHMEDILDANNRQRASRYTSLVFGTREPIQELFRSSTFFGFSHLLSIMYNPKGQYEQSSYLRPLTMQEFVRNMEEKAFTALLPSIGLVKGDWTKSEEQLNVQYYDGLFAFNRKSFDLFMPVGLTSGFRWIDPRFRQYILETEDVDGGGESQNDNEERMTATVNIERSLPHYEAIVDGDKPRFNLTVKVKGHVVELSGPINEQEIQTRVEEKIKQEMEATYKYACKEKVDLFLLEEVLYRDHNAYWKQLLQSGRWTPQEGDLQIKVEFDLTHSGKFNLT
ncbi:germination protein, Ger(x)C family [Paenibacillaceae bacterium GAS479]|nr:germination protein, Ger(x)C family [Paenibacillaceae bacterium GAS479]